MPISTDIGPLMERARLLRLKQDHVSRYSGVNTTVLSRAQNYGQYVEAADFRKIEAFIDAAEELTRRAGAALDWRDFSAVDRLLKEFDAEKKNPPGPPTERDWELMRLVHTMKAVDIAKHLGIELSDLRQQLTDAARRFDFSTNQLAARNADIGRLSEQTIAALDASQAKRNQQ